VVSCTARGFDCSILDERSSLRIGIAGYILIILVVLVIDIEFPMEAFQLLEEEAIQLYDELFQRTNVEQFVPFSNEAKQLFGWNSSTSSTLPDSDLYAKARLSVICSQIGYFLLLKPILTTAFF
jgi:hypothetical protein